MRGAPVLVAVDQWGKRQLSKGQVLRGKECKPRSRGGKPGSGYRRSRKDAGVPLAEGVFWVGRVLQDLLETPEASPAFVRELGPLSILHL